MKEQYQEKPDLPQGLMPVIRAKVSHELHNAERKWMKGQGEKEGPSSQIRSILNKITKENYPDLSLDFVVTCIKGESELQGIVYMLVQKAIGDPDFVVMYAHLCFKTINYCKATHPKIAEAFRTMLLNECKSEYYAELEIKKEDEDGKEIPKEEIEYRTDMYNKNHINLSIFLSYLCIVKVVPKRLITMLISDIISNPDELSVESLCNILTITALDLLKITEAEVVVNEAHQFLKKIADQKEDNKYHSRIIYLIQDILDLEQQDWVISKSKIKDQMKLLTDLEASAPQITDDDMRHNLHYSRSEFVRTVYDDDSVDKDDWIDLSANKKAKSNKNANNKKKNFKKQNKNKKDKKDKDGKDKDNKDNSGAGAGAGVVVDENKAKTEIIDAVNYYLSDSNFTPVLKLCKDNINYQPLFVKETMLYGMEKVDKIDQLSALLSDSVKQIITPENFIEGLKKFFEVYEDTSVDVPKIHDLSSSLLVRVICEKSIDAAWFTTANVKACGLNNEMADKFMTELKDKVEFQDDSIHINM